MRGSVGMPALAEVKTAVGSVFPLQPWQQSESDLCYGATGACTGLAAWNGSLVCREVSQLRHPSVTSSHAQPSSAFNTCFALAGLKV
jgi:hypothetical protein